MRFLGMVNFYRRFVKDAASIIKRLSMRSFRALLQTAVAKRIVPFLGPLPLKKLSTSSKALWQTLPSLFIPVLIFLSVSLSTPPTLAWALFYNSTTTTAWEPLAFWSCTLNPAQRSYSAYDKELLAAYSAVRHFKDLLEGRSFTLYTDHKPLMFMFTKRHQTATPRQIRQINFLSEFNLVVQHLPGSTNIPADTLSRIGCSPITCAAEINILTSSHLSR